MIRRHPLRRIWGRAGFEARDASAESLCAQLALIRLNSPVSGVCGAASNSLTGAILGVHATRSGVPSWRTAVAPIAARLRELLRPAGVGCRFWSRLVAVAALPLLGVAPWFGTASAQTCPNSSGVVTASGISCSIPPASTVNRITGSSDAMITANGVRVSVPFGVGVTSQTGSLITFGVDPVAGGSSIVSEFGGGGITVLLANGMSSRIDASDLNVTFGGGGNIMVEAQAGGQITLRDGAAIDILNSGGNQGLLATGDEQPDHRRQHHRDGDRWRRRFRRPRPVGRRDRSDQQRIQLQRHGRRRNGGGRGIPQHDRCAKFDIHRHGRRRRGRRDQGRHRKQCLADGRLRHDDERRRRRDRGADAGSGFDLLCNRCSNHAHRLGRRHRRQGGEWRRGHADWRLGFGCLHRGWRERDLGDRRRQFDHRDRSVDFRPIERGRVRRTGRYGRNDCA